MSREELQKDNFAFTSMAAAIFYGNAGVASTLIEKANVPVNKQGNTGNSALHFAAKWGQLAVARYLLQNAADVTLTNKDGDTALSLSQKYGNRDITTLLRNNGAV
ncbi:ankyrin repeat-containing domain protein [Ochromonadaceae sp. CCMP2298]|nr:ankyrin repeat-containing domain protein [Ochromonadaceae sp. CCMP2298]